MSRVRAPSPALRGRMNASRVRSAVPKYAGRIARVAQLVEHTLGKGEVIGSIPIASSVTNHEFCTPLGAEGASGGCWLSNPFSFRASRYGQGKVRADEAARERRDDRHVDHGKTTLTAAITTIQAAKGLAQHGGVRPDRQGAGGEGARHHDRDRARGVRVRRSGTTRTSTARATPTT